MSKVSVTIYNIKNNQAKLAFIFKLVQQSLEEEKRLLILVANQQAGEFLDNLLWKNPPESFYPHVFTQHCSPEWIVITEQLSNLNQATSLLNLTGQPVVFFQEFTEIIELNDQTSKEKEELSRQKINYYRSQALDCFFAES